MKSITPNVQVTKLSERLGKDGYQPIPDDYWFKLVSVESPNQMRNNIIYVDRNPYEQEASIPGGYPWGSSYLQYSFVYKMISAPRAENLSKRELERITGTRKPIPPDWQFHPEYGLLPSSFVDTTLYKKVFKGPKDYQSRLVKDYEAFVNVALSLEESMTFSKEELDDVVKHLLLVNYSGRRLSQLSNDEKARLAVTLMKQYSLSDTEIASAMNMSECVIRQFLNAKDYGKRRQ